jgi:hypothetical protein
MQHFRIAIAAFILTASLFAQNPFGKIAGRVTDASSRAVARASVRVTHVETNVTNTVFANEEGNYEALNLIPGMYNIVVAHPGFKQFARNGIEVHVGDSLNIPASLEIGAVTEAVVVTGDSPLLETTNADVGLIIDNKRLNELPLPGGQPMYLMQLSPGVVSTNPPTHGWLPHAVDSISNQGAAGTRTRSSEFTLDGIPNMAYGGQVSFSPPPEMVQEFRITTSPFDASVGHFSGAYVNMVIKSGTNALHGTGYFLSLVPPWATHDFFTNRFIYDTRSGPPTPEKIESAWPSNVSTYHQRYTLGGPAYIPKFYDGRNRTFWSYGLDKLDRFRPERGTFTVPTLEQRNGDFSKLLTIGPNYAIYDPKSVKTATTAGRFTRTPFPGNIVPASALDPMAQKIIGYFALPNATTTADGINNYTDPQPRTIDFHSHTLRMDHSLTEKHRLYATITTSFLHEINGLAFHNEVLGNDRNRFHRGLGLGTILMLRPNFVLDLRYGLTRFIQEDRPPSIGYNLGSLGFPPALTKLLDPAQTSFPEIAILNYSTIGNDTGTRKATLYHTLSATFSQQRGNHSLRFGGEFRVLNENDRAPGNVSPHIDFAAAWTKGPLDNAAASPMGQGMASFLMGLPTSGWTDRNSSFAESSKYFGMFLQDDWKLSRRLTVNAGLRYEMELPTTERFNRSVRGFDFTTPSPIAAAARAAYAASPIAEIPAGAFNPVGGLLFANVNGTPRGMWNTDKNNFAPRVGVAFAMNPKTVLRAGYAIYYESLGSDRNDVMQQGYNQQTLITPSLDNGFTFHATLANPLPDGILEPQGSSAGLATWLGRAPSFFTPSRKTGYMQRWSFTAQRTLMRRTMMEVGYMGNRGTGLGLADQSDPVPAQYLSASPVRDTAIINQLTRQVTNPFYNLPEFAGGGLTGRTVAANQLMRPYPQFTGVSTVSSGGFSWYHSLQVRLDRRFGNGFTVSGAYTFSKFMEAIEKLNPTDLAPTHVVSPQDRPQRFILSGIYEFPFGRGRKWVQGGIANFIFGGWSGQAVWLLQSGAPINFGNIIFNGDIHDIPLPADQRTIERWFNTDAGFEKNSAKALAQNIRTFPLRFNGIRGDGYNNWDMSVSKNFRIREKYTLQFRGEAQDAMNHPVFAAPNAAPANLNFGAITGNAAPEQRRINMVAKFTF